MSPTYYYNTVLRLAPLDHPNKGGRIGIPTLDGLGPRALSPGRPCEAGPGRRRGPGIESG